MFCGNAGSLLFGGNTGSLLLGGKAGSLLLGSSAGSRLFCGKAGSLLFGGSAGSRLFCGNTSGLLLGGSAGSLGRLVTGQQVRVDDDGLQIAGALLDHQGAGALLLANGRRIRRRGDGGVTRLGRDVAGAVADSLGLGCLRLDNLGLFFLAAEPQPGKQTFCHLKILTSLADC